MTPLTNPTCTMCNRNFQNMEQLQIHMQVIHGESDHERIDRLTDTISVAVKSEYSD